jgi:hypothetical protein
MASDQGVTGLAIETDQIMVPLFVTAFLDHEAKINRDPLIAGGGPHRHGVSGRLFAELFQMGHSSSAFRMVNSGIPFTKRCIVDSRRKFKCPNR